ncbi:hypothetical protein [Streptomyces sp. HUCO-GS316]|uniref:hypothetical protein n=1 Tax=Streptomyces sp. HUCO-GS316 TaxID=2692198 RepID=UPI001928A59F|nr:hypothetical protein [Streptomyces sp. HUCO-GS316]
MSKSASVEAKTSHGPSWRHFIRHFFEMVAAMVVGMAVLAPVWVLIFWLLGHSSVLDYADVHALVMATDMTIGMSVWMRYRGHGWASIAEMAGAMFVPFLVFFGPYWAGLVSGGTMLTLGHVLMLPCMLLVMLRRRDEYSQDHRQHRWRSAKQLQYSPEGQQPRRPTPTDLSR